MITAKEALRRALECNRIKEEHRKKIKEENFNNAVSIIEKYIKNDSNNGYFFCELYYSNFNGFDEIKEEVKNYFSNLGFVVNLLRDSISIKWR